MNYTTASAATSGADVQLVKKLPFAVAHEARNRIVAADASGAVVLARLDAVVRAVEPVLLVDLNANATDANLNAAVVALWPVVAAVATEIDGNG